MNARRGFLIGCSIAFSVLLVLGNVSGLLPVTRYRESSFVAYREVVGTGAEKAGMVLLSSPAVDHWIIPYILSVHEQGPTGEYSLELEGFPENSRIVAEKFYDKNGRVMVGSNSGATLSGCAIKCRIIRQLSAGLELPSLEKYTIDVGDGGGVSHWDLKVVGHIFDVISTPFLLELTN